MNELLTHLCDTTRTRTSTTTIHLSARFGDEVRSDGAQVAGHEGEEIGGLGDRVLPHREHPTDRHMADT